MITVEFQKTFAPEQPLNYPPWQFVFKVYHSLSEMSQRATFRNFRTSCLRLPGI